MTSTEHNCLLLTSERLFKYGGQLGSCEKSSSRAATTAATTHSTTFSIAVGRPTEAGRSKIGHMAECSADSMDSHAQASSSSIWQ